jgi:hypothetical protein
VIRDLLNGCIRNVGDEDSAGRGCIHVNVVDANAASDDRHQSWESIQGCSVERLDRAKDDDFGIGTIGDDLLECPQGSIEHGRTMILETTLQRGNRA